MPQVSAIARSVHSRRPFDLTQLRWPSAEVLLTEGAVLRVTPLLQQPGRLVCTDMELCYQPYTQVCITQVLQSGMYGTPAQHSGVCCMASIAILHPSASSTSPPHYPP